MIDSYKIDMNYVAKEQNFKLRVISALLNHVMIEISEDSYNIPKKKRESLTYFVNTKLLELAFSYSQDEIVNNTAKFKVGRKVIKAEDLHVL